MQRHALCSGLLGGWGKERPQYGCCGFQANALSYEMTDSSAVSLDSALSQGAVPPLGPDCVDYKGCRSQRGSRQMPPELRSSPALSTSKTSERSSQGEVRGSGG